MDLDTKQCLSSGRIRGKYTKREVEYEEESNALKFTESGGVVSLRAYGDEKFVFVEVKDTGCGMSQETKANIFKKFFQGDTSHATKGNGLGLALAKRVIDIWNGEISVSSQLGEGSTFTVRLNRAR